MNRLSEIGDGLGFACRFDGGVAMGFCRTGLPLVVGLALFWAWTHLLVFSPTSWLTSYWNAGTLWLVSNVISLIALVAIFLLARRRPALFDGYPFLWCVSACSVLASCTLFASNLPPICSLIGMMVASVCDMLLIGVWAMRYAQLGSLGEQTRVTLISMLFSFLLFIMLYVLPTKSISLIVCALPVGSAACLVISRKGILDKKTISAPCSMPGANLLLRPPFIVLGYIFVFSIPLNYLQNGGINIGLIWASGSGGVVFALALSILGLACFAEQWALRRGLTALPTAAVLLLSASLLAAPFASAGNVEVVSACMVAGYFLFLSVTYLQLGRFVYERHNEANAPCVFSFGMIANALGLLLGSALGILSKAVSPVVASMCTIVIVYGLFLLGITILPRKMKAMLFGIREHDVQSEPQNRYVEGMVASIKAQCSRVAAAFGLTPREESVLGYLVRGWNLQMIGEAEGLTRNTVKTHVTHIYQKLGVHTREEMALIVESIDKTYPID